jgi:lysozyme
MSKGVGRGLLPWVIIGSLVLAPPVLAAEQGAAVDNARPASESFRRTTEEAAALAGGLAVRLNKSSLRDGDLLVVTVDVPSAGYLNVVSVGPDDVPTVLFPNRHHSDNRVAAGAFGIPTEKMKFDLKATKPYGPTLVAAFLSTEPLDFYQDGAGERDVQGRMHEQFALLSASSRRQLENLATKSFAVTPRAAPLLGGMAYALVCAASGPCDAAAMAPESGGLPLAERLVPGILLDPERELPLPRGGQLRPVYDKGIRLTKLSEGFVSRLYNDPAGYCTIAYGHLIRKAPCDGSEPADFRNGVSEPQGETLLVADMSGAQSAVTRLVNIQLSDGQYAALCDFTYNVGAGNLQRSTLLKVVNAGEHHRVPLQLARWNKADGKEYRGLTIRRQREIALYFEGRPIPKALPGGENLTPIDIRVGE